jgi:hypothetical protein
MSIRSLKNITEAVRIELFIFVGEREFIPKNSIY